MLVLSRRPSEKILFPSVGISVEIVQTKGNTVRVGIEAPEDIRILRGELQQQSKDSLMQLNRTSLNAQTNSAKYQEAERAEVLRRMEEIELALALAQNQQQQGLSEHAGIALEQAVQQLQQLKQVFVDSQESQTMVCEKKPVYSTRKPATELVLGVGDGHGFRLEFDLGV